MQTTETALRVVFLTKACHKQLSVHKATGNTYSAMFINLTFNKEHLLTQALGKGDAVFSSYKHKNKNKYSSLNHVKSKY